MLAKRRQEKLDIAPNSSIMYAQNKTITYIATLI